jgi:streptogramin lyase
MNMRKYLICVAASCLVLAGCSGHQALPAPGSHSIQPNHQLVNPYVVQTGKIPVQWTQFPWGDTNLPNQVNGIVTGSDKNVWYTDYNGQALIKMQMSGKTTKFALAYGTGTHFYPGNLTVGADGKFYISAYANPGFIGVAKTTGSFSVTAIASGDYGYAGGLTKGPDGNVWFTELAHVAKITPGGTITEFPYADGYTTNYYGSIAVGSDGDLWVTEYGVDVIDDVDPADGSMTQYSLPCAPIGLIAANDGNLWASCNTTSLLRITTSGTYTAFANPLGTDGYPSSFTVGQDGNMWTVDGLGKTDVYIINPLGVAPSSITFHVGNTQTLTVTENGTTAWTATSTNPGVASVAQGSPANKFVATANGLGNTVITIKDAIGNSFAVKVKVN